MTSVIAAAATPLVVMGVSGCGKSSLGQALADRLGYQFLEGDDFHPKANVAKMRAGTALDDADRAPWLAQLASQLRSPGQIVLTCSALKKAYRDKLREAESPPYFIYLQGSREIIAARLENRLGHYMPATLLASQLATLEEPGTDEPHLTVSLSQPLDALIRDTLARLAELGIAAPAGR